MRNVLIAGCGKIGISLGLRLAEIGHQIWGLRRHAEKLPAPIQPLKADLLAAGSLQILPSKIDLVFYIVTPDRFDDASYRIAYVQGLKNLLSALARTAHPVQRIFFTSSTSIYTQLHGECVDESSPTEPKHFSGNRILEAEMVLAKSSFPSTRFRLSGIYGPGRTRMIERLRRGEIALPEEGSTDYTNLIHEEDVVGSLLHLAILPNPETVYIGVDHEPVERRQLLQWLAEKLNVTLPNPHKVIDSPRQRPRSNKRCSNSRLVQSGYRFRYPTYRDGFLELI